MRIQNRPNLRGASQMRKLPSSSNAEAQTEEPKPAESGAEATAQCPVETGENVSESSVRPRLAPSRLFNNATSQIIKANKKT